MDRYENSDRDRPLATFLITPGIIVYLLQPQARTLLPPRTLVTLPYSLLTTIDVALFQAQNGANVLGNTIEAILSSANLGSVERAIRSLIHHQR